MAKKLFVPEEIEILLFSVLYGATPPYFQSN